MSGLRRSLVGALVFTTSKLSAIRTSLFAASVFLLLLGVPHVGAAETDSLAARVDQPPARWDLALRGGWAVTSFDHSTTLPEGATTEPIAGWMFGFDSRWRISETWSVESGLYVVRKGNADYYAGPLEILGFTLQAGLKAKTTLTYLVVPVRIKLKSSACLRPYVRLGFDLAPLVDAASHLTGTIAGNAGSAPIDQETNVLSSFKRFEFALAMDAGVKVPIAKFDAFLELTGSLGVTDIIEDEQFDAHNRTVGIVLGIVLPRSQP